jgi:hypothetical protein
MRVPEPDVCTSVRKAARAFEAALPPDQRKRLGQFFTGLPLGKLLAHLAVSADTRTVLDPMAGHGDLLDAMWQAANERGGVSLAHLDGIEIEEDTAQTCRDRLDAIVGRAPPERTLLTGSAFEERQLARLTPRLYDLVITNPPYVRYQGRNGIGASTAVVREALKSAIASVRAAPDAHIWRALADGYSGLSDLSVPSWLLAGLLVRPGGRLALVAPATWRSRDYADVVRYLILRCFELEVIVEDTQPGWFSDALVRTHLIVARRLDADATIEPLGSKGHWPSLKWVRVAPRVANEHSLVGAAFNDEHPEARFASWLNGKAPGPAVGIEVEVFDLGSEWASLHPRIRRHRWYKDLETRGDRPSLFSSSRASGGPFFPPSLRNMLPARAQANRLVTLDESGIKVGQGLRTGCNIFFYVDTCGPEKAGMVPVRGAAALGAPEFLTPAETLRPVVRRQAEVQFLADDNLPPGCVLDLRSWVLPEDEDAVRAAQYAYEASGQTAPRTMPKDLAAFVRRAAIQAMPGSGRPIPDLTAVRTNARVAGRRGQVPRFWYMLPDFAPRHLPAAFIPRVIHNSPWAERNTDPPILIDANFSAFWTTGKRWNSYSLKALLNTVWCRTFMELIGTPLGGGALKLEATHLRRMALPRLDETEERALAAVGKDLDRNDVDAQAEIDAIVLRAVIKESASDAILRALAEEMAAHAQLMRGARQKVAP